MNLKNILDILRVNPEQLLDSVSPIALEAFFTGYGAANEAVFPLLRSLDARVEGLTEASVFSRVYLKFGTAEAVATIVNLMTEAREDMGADTQARSGNREFADGSFIPTIVRAIEEGRPGMMLGEPTITWLANCWHGYVLGLEEANPATAVLERARLTAFQTWVAEQYEDPSAAWYKLIRVYYGPCAEGLRTFAKLWREFAQEFAKASDLQDR